MTRSPARRALRVAGVLAAAAFVALLAYGLTTKATNSTIDDALSRGEAVPAPGFTLSALSAGRDPGNDTQRAWGVTGLPETYFIAADGSVVGHVIGTVDDGQLRDGIAAARSGRPAGADQGGEQRPVK